MQPRDYKRIFSMAPLREIANRLADRYESATVHKSGPTYSSCSSDRLKSFAITRAAQNIIRAVCQSNLTSHAEKVASGGIAFRALYAFRQPERGLRRKRGHRVQRRMKSQEGKKRTRTLSGGVNSDAMTAKTTTGRI